MGLYEYWEETSDKNLQFWALYRLQISWASFLNMKEILQTREAREGEPREGKKEGQTDDRLVAPLRQLSVIPLTQQEATQCTLWEYHLI